MASCLHTSQRGVDFTKFFHDLDLDSLHKYQDIIPWTCRTLWGLDAMFPVTYNVVFKVEIDA